MFFKVSATMRKKVVKPKPKTKRVRNTIKRFDIDIVCNRLVEGVKWQYIADEFKMPVSTLHNFISNNTEFSARVKLAKETSSESYADKAEQVLLQAEGTKEELMRARELAQHYRWMAGKRNPKKYGDRVDVTTDGEKINSPVFVVNAVVNNELAKLGEPAKELTQSTDQ